MQPKDSLTQELAIRLSSVESDDSNVSQDTTKSGSLLTPLYNVSSKPPSNSVIKKQIIKRFQKEQYKELKTDLDLYRLHINFQEFFSSEEGSSVLYWTINNAASDRPLRFLVENLGKDALSNALKDDDFYNLKSFLTGESGIEEAGLYTDKRGDFQKEIFKLLLSIDPKGIQELMQRDVIKKDVTENVDKNFKAASAQHRQLQSFEKH